MRLEVVLGAQAQALTGYVLVDMDLVARGDNLHLLHHLPGSGL